MRSPDSINVARVVGSSDEGKVSYTNQCHHCNTSRRHTSRYYGTYSLTSHVYLCASLDGFPPQHPPPAVAFFFFFLRGCSKMSCPAVSFFGLLCGCTLHSGMSTLR